VGVSKSICTWGICGLMVAAMTAAAQAGTYNETTNGDLSDIPASPTPWTLSLGPNTLIGSAGTTYIGEEEDQIEIDDFDLVSFTIPAGNKLASIAVNSIQNPDELSFFAIQAGTPWLDGLGNNLNGTYLLGYSLLPPMSGVADMLKDMTGRQLGAGVYTFECQDVDYPFQYSLTFNVGLAGDFDDSHLVSGGDLTQWRGDVGLNSDSNSDGDADSDGQDFLVWQRQLSATSPLAAIPEPSSVVLTLSAAGHGLMARRRRGR
jgi:hypothetical protein